MAMALEVSGSGRCNSKLVFIKCRVSCVLFRLVLPFLPRVLWSKGLYGPSHSRPIVVKFEVPGH